MPIATPSSPSSSTASKRSRKQHATQSLKPGSGAIKLDVYSLYLANPQTLLYNKLLNKRPVAEPSDDEELKEKPKRGKRRKFDLANEDLDQLMDREKIWLGILRLPVERYLHVKHTMLSISARQKLKKSEYQKMFKMDVSKVGKIYDWFLGAGWI